MRMRALTLVVALCGAIGAFAADTCDLTLASTTGGNAQINDGGWQDEGVRNIDTNTWYDIRGTVDANYKFVRWEKTGSDRDITVLDLTDRTTSIFITADAAVTTTQTAGITAVFAAATQATVTLNVPDPAGGNPRFDGGAPGDHVVNANERYDINANPLDSYNFTGWTTTGGVSVLCAAAEDTIAEVTGDGTLTASYALEVSVTVTMSENDAGFGTAIYQDPRTWAWGASGEAPVDTWFNINAAPAAGYRFTGWTVVSGGAIIQESDKSATQAWVTADSEIRADFAATETVYLMTTVSPEAAQVDLGTVTAVNQVANTFTVLGDKRGYTEGGCLIQIVGSSGDPNNDGYYYVDGDSVRVSNGPWAVTAVDQAGKQFTIGGDQTASFGVGDTVTVAGSTGNDGDYTIVTATLNAGSTDVVVSEAIPDATVDGTLDTYSTVVTVDPLEDVANIPSPNADGTMYGFTPGSATLFDGTDILMEGSVPVGQWIAIEAEDVTGYQFVKWTSGSNAIIENCNLRTTNVALASTETVTAVFASTVDLAMSQTGTNGDGAAGALNPADRSTTAIASEIPYTITANPNPGSEFVEWTATSGADNCEIIAPDAKVTDIILTGDATLQARFRVVTDPTVTCEIEVDVSPVDGGAIGGDVVAGLNTLDTLRWYDISAVAEAGYYFLNWTMTGDISVEDPADPSTSFYPTGDGTITANFAADSDPERVCLTVSCSPQYGGDVGAWGDVFVGVNCLQAEVWYDAIAVAEDGFEFVHWVVGDNVAVLDTTDRTTEVTAADDGTLMAVFQRVTPDTDYELTLSVSPVLGGDTNPAQVPWGPYQVRAGGYYSISAIPNDGYRFVRWQYSGGVAITDATAMQPLVQLTADAGVTALFEAVETAQLTIAMEPEYGGAEDIYGVGAYNVNQGEWLNVDADANDGYEFSYWSCSGDIIVLDAHSEWTQIYLTGDGELTANFRFIGGPQETASLIFAENNPEMGTSIFVSDGYPGGRGTGEYEVNIREQLNAEATPELGYRFTGWTFTGDIYVDEPWDDDINFVVLGDSTLTANYAATPVVEMEMALSPAYGGDENFFGAGLHEVGVANWYSIEADAFTGFVFSEWEYSDTVSVLDPYSADTDFTVSAAGVITAVFNECDTGSLTIAIDPEDGGQLDTPFGDTPGTFTQNVGERFDVDCDVATGFAFTGWEYCGDIQACHDPAYASCEFVLTGTGASSLTATLAEADLVTVTVLCDPAYSADTGVYQFNRDEWVYIVANQAWGFDFAGWEVTSGTASILDVNDRGTWAYFSEDTVLTINCEASDASTSTLTLTCDSDVGLDGVEIDGSTAGLGTHYLQTNRWYELDAYVMETDGSTRGWVLDGFEVTGDAWVRWCPSRTQYYLLMNGDATVEIQLREVDVCVLTIDADPAGAGTEFTRGLGTFIVPQNEWLGFEAYAYHGWKFDGAELDSTGSGYLRNEDQLYFDGFLTDADATLTLNYSQCVTATMTLVAAPDGGGYLNPLGGTHVVNVGEELVVTAYPANGYVVSGWSLLLGTAEILRDESAPWENSVRLVPSTNCVLEVQFATATDSVFTMATNPVMEPGWTDPFAGVYNYSIGTWLTISADEPCGWEFVRWDVTGCDIVDNQSESTHIQLTAATSSATAVFRPIDEADLLLSVNPVHALQSGFHGDFQVADDYQLQSDAAGTPAYINWERWAPGVHRVEVGKSYLIKTMLYSEFKFVQWTSLAGDITIVEVPSYYCWKHENETWYYLTVTSTTDASLEATCAARDYYTLTFEIDDASGGSVAYMPEMGDWQIAGSSILVPEGVKQSLKAYTAEGYYFWGWKVIKGNATIDFNFDEDSINVATVNVLGDATVRLTFDTSVPVVPVLTVSPPVITNGGTTDPEVGAYQLQQYEPYTISATPENGYYFIRWAIANSDNGWFGSAVSADTSVTLAASTAITPVFGVQYDEGIDVTSAAIKLNSPNDPLKPKDSVKIKAVLKQTPDLSGGAIIGVNGYELTISSWTKEPLPTDKKQVYEYTSDDKTVKVKFDLTKGTADISLSKMDLFDRIDPAKGIDVYVITGSTKYSDSIVCDEKTSWKYKAADKTDDISSFSATCNVGKANGDQFAVAGLDMTEPAGFDATTIIKLVFVGGAAWTIDPADTLTTTVKASGAKYSYKVVSADKKLEPEQVQLKLDFTGGKKWSFKATKSDKGGLLPRNGEVVFSIEFYNPATGAQMASYGYTIPPEVDTETNDIIIKTSLKYKQKK